MSAIDQTCGYQGTLTNGTCVCRQGWTSIGDFNPVRYFLLFAASFHMFIDGAFSQIDGVDCYNNILSLQVIIWVSLILGTLSQILFTHHIYKRLLISRALDLRMRFMLYYLIQTAFSNIYDIVSLVAPTHAVWGYSVPLTLILSIAMYSAYGGCVIFFQVIMVFLDKIVGVLSAESQVLIRGHVSLFNLRANMMHGICIVCASIPLVSYSLSRLSNFIKPSVLTCLVLYEPGGTFCRA